MPHQEFSVMSAKNLALYGQEWTPDNSPRAVIGLIHGLGEHSGRYKHVADFYNRNNIAVIAVDLHGHGKTEGQRGHADSYDDILDDIANLQKEAENRHPGIPLFLYGHSMGGNLLLTYLIKRSPQIAGAIVTSPGLAPATDMGATLAIGKILYAIIPSFPMNNGLDITGISQDSRVIEQYKADPLVHPKASVRLGLDIINHGKWILENASCIQTPMLLMVGSADRVINVSAVQKLSKILEGKIAYHEYPGGYHELHNEPFKEKVLGDQLSWIDQVLFKV